MKREIMKREIVKLPEDSTERRFLLHDENIYEEIEDEKIYFDTEKAYTESRVIVKRISDGKFFAVTLTRAGAGYNEYENEMEEVFPRKITTIIYD